MSDFGFDPYAEDEIDPTLVALIAALDRQGGRSSFSQKNGLRTYTDPTQVPYDAYNAVSRAEKLQGVPLWAQTASGYDTAEPFQGPTDYVPSAAVFAGRTDFTGRVLSAALADLEAGDDPNTVAADVQAVLKSSPEAADFDQAEYTDVFSRAVSGGQKLAAAKQQYDTKYGVGAADRSLAGEQVQYEVPVAKGLPAGPLGTESVWGARFGNITPDDLMAAQDADNAFATKQWGYETRWAPQGPSGSSGKTSSSNAPTATTYEWPEAGSMGEPVRGTTQSSKSSTPSGGVRVQQGKTATAKPQTQTRLIRKDAVDTGARSAAQEILRRAFQFYSQAQQPTKAQNALDQRRALYASYLGG